MKRNFTLAAIVVVAVAIIALFAHLKLSAPNFELKTYFADAQGLRVGAPVRVAGVDVGRVTSVRARPERGHAPAEVVMVLTTPYELKVPADSTVSLRTAGVLGETYADIEVQDKSAPPAADGAVLKAVEVPTMSTQEMLNRLDQSVQHLDRSVRQANGAQNAKPVAPTEKPRHKQFH